MKGNASPCIDDKMLQTLTLGCKPADPTNRYTDEFNAESESQGFRLDPFFPDSPHFSNCLHPQIFDSATVAADCDATMSKKM
ncbi:MAG TPA: hypothetical protein PKW76_04135 [bacterium]|nr:hypothetical protein [bacterium]HPG44848.1 hypothetical protein [bacterium]HPM98123.1 hypothetical protein [bacterium]